MDASQEQTDIPSFAPLEPIADGFRNYLRGKQRLSPEDCWWTGRLQTLSAPEMTVFFRQHVDRLGGKCRDDRGRGLHPPVGIADNRLRQAWLDMRTDWQPVSDAQDLFEGHDRKTNEVKWTATRADLIFGSHSQLRALAELYACDDSKEKFVKALSWLPCSKVMNLRSGHPRLPSSALPTKTWTPGTSRGEGVSGRAQTGSGRFGPLSRTSAPCGPLRRLSSRGRLR